MIPSKKFQPEVHYQREEEQVIIGQDALLPVPRLHTNNDVPHVSNIPTSDPEIPKKARVAVTAPVLECDGPTALKPVPSAPPAPDVDVKTTNTKLDSVSGSARKTRKNTVVFAFPDTKSHRKQ